MRRAYWFILIVLALLPGLTSAQGDANADAAANGVVISQAHYFIAPSVDGIRIAEFYLIGNTGDHVYEGRENVDGTRTTLMFTLPEGARDLVFDGPGLGERYVGDTVRFADTRSIPPGAAVVEVAFSYALSLTGKTRIERATGVPLVSATLIVSGESVGLTGPGLIPQGTMDTQMGPATAYSAGPFAADEALAFTVVSQAAVSSRAREVGLGVAALLVAGVVSYRLWRSTSGQTPEIADPPQAARPLLEAIAALDARFAEGDFPEVAYRQEREALKQQLCETLRENT